MLGRLPEILKSINDKTLEYVDTLTFDKSGSEPSLSIVLTNGTTLVVTDDVSQEFGYVVSAGQGGVSRIVNSPEELFKFILNENGIELGRLESSMDIFKSFLESANYKR